jgi:hypothetical protein
MKPTIHNDLAYRLSIVIGPLSAPFAVQAAGLQDFASLHFAHLLIIVCYILGAIALSQLLLRALLRVIKNRTAASLEPTQPDGLNQP